MENEIDLIDMYNSIAGKAVKKRRHLIILFLLSMGVTLFVFMLAPRFYVTNMLCSSKYLKAEVLHQLAKNLNTAIRQETVATISAMLHEEESVVSGLYSVKVNEVKSEAYLPNQENRDNIFEVVIITRSTENYDKIQKAIINYFQENEFVDKRTRVNEETMRRQLQKIKREMEELDKIRKEFYTASSKNAMILDPSALNETMVGLGLKETQLEIELRLISPFQIIQNFVVFDKPFFPRPWHALVFAVGLWLVIGAFVVFIKK